MTPKETELYKKAVRIAAGAERRFLDALTFRFITLSALFSNGFAIINIKTSLRKKMLSFLLT